MENFESATKLIKFDNKNDYIKYNNILNYANDELEIKQTKINIAIMVKNQEELICETISNIYHLADKLYLVDTGSSDNTLKNVREKFGTDIEISNLEWVEDYSFMRNSIINLIPQGEWIFFVDSDEVLVSNIDQFELKKILYSLEIMYGNNDIVLTVKQTAEGNSLVGSPQRIFKNSNTLRFFGYVHEELRSNKIINLNSTIKFHNLGTSDLEYEKFNKYERYNSLLIKNINKEKDYLKWFALLDTDYGIEHLKDYRKYLQKHYLNVCKYKLYTPDDIFGIKFMLNKISFDIMRGNITQAEKDIDFSLDYFEENILFYYIKYFAGIAKIQFNCEKLFSEFRHDVELLKKKEFNDNSIVLLDIDLLEEIMSKLLFKMEKYELSYDILKKHNSTSKLLKPEIDFLNQVKSC